MPNLLIVGPPGAGKGTQAARIAEALRVPAVSTGDIFRQNIKERTELGQRVTAITMTLTDGSVVDFASCHTCEHKSWKQGGVDLDITTVLSKTKKLKP